MLRDPKATCGTCCWWLGTSVETVSVLEGSVLNRFRAGYCNHHAILAERNDGAHCDEHPGNVKLRVQAEESWREDVRWARRRAEVTD